MKELVQHPAVVEKVYAVLADTLGLDESTLEEHGSLIDDYKAESLDFLDISFRLNKEFGIKLFRGDFLERASEILDPTGEAILHEGWLTQAGVDLLKARLPESAANPLLVVNMPKTAIQRLYTAQSWVRLVNELLENPGLTGEEFLIQWLNAYRASRQG